MLLKGKNAIVYGGSGLVGSAVARAFAREEANEFLVGRTLSTLDKVAEEIATAGRRAETAQIDAFNEVAVDRHAVEVVRKAGSIDISFNAVSFGDVQKPIIDMSCDEFAQSVTNAVRSQFLSSSAAARYMVKQGSGVIPTVTGYGPPTPSLGNTGVIRGAVESICRQLASDLGPQGIRVT
jgi:NAD(P)-dependent dehydrogenase (short-subunit alcohol dehydrogenase family)